MILLAGNHESSNESIYNAVLGILEKQDKLSIATKKKKDSTVINTQIGVISDSVDYTRKSNNINVITQSFRAIDGDNELIADKVKKPFYLEQTNFNTKLSTISTDEGANFIQIPKKNVTNTTQNKSHINRGNESPRKIKKSVIYV